VLLELHVGERDQAVRERVGRVGGGRAAQLGERLPRAADVDQRLAALERRVPRVGVVERAHSSRFSRM
jgi:hypothetical protein